MYLRYPNQKQNSDSLAERGRCAHARVAEVVKDVARVHPVPLVRRHWRVSTQNDGVHDVFDQFRDEGELATLVMAVEEGEQRSKSAAKVEEGETKPRNPLHFQTIEGGRDSVPDTCCTSKNYFSALLTRRFFTLNIFR